MKVCRTIKELKIHLSEERKKEKSFGFVPTMGALHQGHIALIEKAKQENDMTAASIFVNPTQFNNKEDLENYPRTEEQDCLMLQNAGCHVVFIPSVEEMYPKNDPFGTGGQDEKNQRWKTVDLGMLDKVMEAKHRPGHFKGVMQVVNKLFDNVEPTRAYFGQKDFQQQAVIKEMVKQLHYNIKIIACPTLREPDGLAMSSRNMRLTAEEKKIAPKIYETLVQAKKVCSNHSPVEVRQFVEENISSQHHLRLEYAEVANAQTLQPISTWENNKEAIVCVAVHLGKVRLIDNVLIE